MDVRGLHQEEIVLFVPSLKLRVARIRPLAACHRSDNLIGGLTNGLRDPAYSVRQETRARAGKTRRQVEANGLMT